VYKDGSIKGYTYEGEIVDGKANGAGKLYLTDKRNVIYEGEFKNDKYNGKGKEYKDIEATCSCSSCFIYGRLLYEGEFKNDKRHGQGTTYYKDGTKQYEGEFKADICKGKGKLYTDDYKEGNFIVEATFEGGKRYDHAVVGHAKVYYENGCVYEGEVDPMCHKRHGLGVLYKTDGTKFEGAFYKGTHWIPKDKLSEHETMCMQCTKQFVFGKSPKYERPCKHTPMCRECELRSEQVHGGCCALCHKFLCIDHVY
jgi:hypothetical protein